MEKFNLPYILKVNLVCAVFSLNLIILAVFNQHYLSWSLVGFVGAALMVIVNQIFAVVQLLRKEYAKARNLQWGVLMGFLTLLMGLVVYFNLY